MNASFMHGIDGRQAVSSSKASFACRVKSDRRVQAKHLKGLRSFLEKEKEQVGILIGRFDKADILEEEKLRIYLMPSWML